MPSKEKIVTFSETKEEILKVISRNNHLPEVLREELAEIIQTKVEEIAGLFPWGPKAIIWSGGFSRGEATYVQGKLLNDVDLFVIDYFLPGLFRAKKLEGWKDLSGDKVKISITISTPGSLKKNKTLANYELIAGAVIYGNKKIKEKIRANSNNLSKFEGLRELFTRLLALQNLNRTNLELNYLTVKTYIACSDSYLIFYNKYIPFYSERRKNIEKVDMPDKLREKAGIAYEFKTGEREKLDLSLTDAKQELLNTIQYSLARYVGKKEKFTSALDALEILNQKFPKHMLLNSFYYWRLKKKGYKPNFFSIIFSFTIIKLYLALLYYEQGNYEMVKETLSEFINIKEVDNLPEVISLYPNLCTIELL